MYSSWGVDIVKIARVWASWMFIVEIWYQFVVWLLLHRIAAGLTSRGQGPSEYPRNLTV